MPGSHGVGETIQSNTSAPVAALRGMLEHLDVFAGFVVSRVS